MGADALRRDRGEGPLRNRVARGALVNGAFLVGVNGLNVIRGVALAALLSTTDYGVWGVVSVALTLLVVFRQAGIADRYVQQDADDQQLAFQRAITLDISLSAVLLVVGLALFPGLALAYGRSELVAPGLVAALVLPAMSLQAPLAVFYRRLDFRRQRTLQAIDPVVGTAVTLTLAALGLGYWAAVIGLLAGAWAAGAAAMLACPYPFAWRWDRETARSYASFSWPLMAGGVAAAIMGQSVLLAGEAQLGLAGAAFIAFSSTVSQYANRVDQIVTSTLYPALCAARDRTEVLLETFLKSNRLAVLWGFPFGVGLVLFAEPFAIHVLGRDWEPAVILLQAIGLSAGIHQIAFNWDAFYRARGDTRPLAWATAIGLVTFFAAPFAGLVAFGLDGLAGGFLVLEAVSLATRMVFVKRFFGRVPLARHIGRALAPTAAAAAAIVAVRSVLGEDGGATRAAIEAAAYAALILAATLAFERSLVGEITGYVRRRGR